MVIRNTLEQTICLELLPRSQIDVCLQVRHASCLLARARARACAGRRTACQARCRLGASHSSRRARPPQVLQADGGARCACVNAATLALAAAGIPMRDMVAGCGVGFLQATPLLDLNHMEAVGGGPDISVALQPNLGRLVLLQMDGKLPQELFEACVALAADGCKAVASVMRQELIRHTKRMALATGGVPS